MNENDKHKNLPTDKTKEELLAAKPEELNPTERYLQGLLRSYSGLTVEEAIEFLNSLP